MPYKDKDKQREYQREWHAKKHATMSSEEKSVFLERRRELKKLSKNRESERFYRRCANARENGIDENIWQITYLLRAYAEINRLGKTKQGKDKKWLDREKQVILTKLNSPLLNSSTLFGTP